MKLQPYKLAVTKKSNFAVSINKINDRCLLRRIQLRNGVLYRLNICTILFTMNGGMNYWVSHSFYSTALPQTKLKSMKKHRSQTTTSMSCELTAITYNFFGALQSNKNFQAPTAWVNRLIARF